MTNVTPIRRPAPLKNLRAIRDPRIIEKALVATFRFRPSAAELEDFLNHLADGLSVPEIVVAMGKNPSFGDNMLIWLGSQLT